MGEKPAPCSITVTEKEFINEHRNKYAQFQPSSCIWGALAQSSKALLASSCPSVCPHESARLPWWLLMGTFMKICPQISNLIKIEQIFRIIYMKSYVSSIVAGEINSLCKELCANLDIFTLLTVTCSSTAHIACIVVFPIQQCMREQTTTLRYT
jgi:hypothetical protein